MVDDVCMYVLSMLFRFLVTTPGDDLAMHGAWNFWCSQSTTPPPPAAAAAAAAAVAAVAAVR